MYTLAPSRQIVPSCGSHTRKDKQIARSSTQWRTVSGWPRTAPKYSCYAQHTADLISYPASHWSGIPRERESRQRPEKEALSSAKRICVEEAFWFIVLANLSTRSQERGVLGFKGRSEVMLTLRTV